MSKNISDFLVICDMDYVLHSAGEQALSSDATVIRLFNSVSGKFSLFTDQTPWEVRECIRPLEITTPMIACSGAIIYDLKRETEIKTACLNEMEASIAVKDLMLHFPSVGVEIAGKDGTIYIVRNNRSAHRSLKQRKIPYQVRPLEEVPHGWLKITVYAGEGQITEMESHTRRKYYGTANEIFRRGADQLMILSSEAKPEIAVEDLCQLLKIEHRNCIALGQKSRDIPLLRAAGEVVAPADAPPVVKHMAGTNTACSLLDGGIGEFLYGLMRANP